MIRVNVRRFVEKVFEDWGELPLSGNSPQSSNVIAGAKAQLFVDWCQNFT
jgi:hypothetical protein